MKLDEIIIDPAANKLKKLVGILTPEVASANYDLISKLLAMKLTSSEMDEVDGIINGVVGKEDVAFYFKLLAKQLAPKVEEIANTTGTKIFGTVFGDELRFADPDIENQSWLSHKQFVQITFEKNRWVAGVWNYRSYTWSYKRFENPAEIMPYLDKHIEKMQEQRAQFLASAKSKNAKVSKST